MSSVLYATVDQLTELDPDWSSRSNVVLAVVREPGSLLQSWYRSNLYSHDRNPDVDRRRAALQPLSTTDGLLLTLDTEFELLLRIMASWCSEAETNPSVLIVQYEKLIAGERGAWWDVFRHLDIGMPKSAQQRLLSRYRVGRGSDLQSLGPKYDRAGRPDISLPPAVEAAMTSRFKNHLERLPYARG